MSCETLSSGLSSLTFSRQALMSFMEEFPADKLCHQLTPGGNHALWILGHLANTDDFFLSSFIGEDQKLPEKWQTLFGMGSTPVGDASAYPSLDEVKQALCDRREAMIGWLNSLSTEKLTESLPTGFEQFAPNYCVFPGTLAWHEGLHAGQLTMIRRDIGLGPKIG